MIDLHTHTTFSYDGSGAYEEMVKQAYENKLNIFGTSEHYDFDTTLYDFDTPMPNVDAYLKAFEKAKQQYSDFKLLFGIELGFDYHNEVKEKYKEIVQKYPFDFIINSVHLTDGKECYFLDYFENKTKKVAYENYLKNVLLSVDAPYDYQVIGHIGYVCRNAPFDKPALTLGEFGDLIDEILKKIISKGKAIELNTSSKTAGSITLPNEEILKRYFELGGEFITFGSDAHNTNRLAENYEKAKELAKSIGFKYFCYFENREMKVFPF